jgi:hypothetical protein
LRAVVATRGNQTLLGCILLAVLGKAASNPPRFGSGAVIRLDGTVTAHFQGRNGAWTEGAHIANIIEVRDGFRRLADALDLGDEDRGDMFTELAKWITHDERALAEGLEVGG